MLILAKRENLFYCINKNIVRADGSSIQKGWGAKEEIGVKALTKVRERGGGKMGGGEEKPLPPFSVDVRGSEIRKERN